MKRSKSRQLVVVAAAVLAAFAVGTAQAAPLTPLSSANFSWRYEMDSAPNNQDLDSNSTDDWFDTDAIPVSGGFANGAGGLFYRGDFNNSIWRAGLYNGDYTIEFSTQVLNSGTEQSSGTVGVVTEKPADSNKGFRFNVARSGQGLAGNKTGLGVGTPDNTDTQHVFRLARQGQDGYWVWRDGVLLNPDANSPFAGNNNTNNNTILLGGFSGSLGGDHRMDYLRLTPGAYAPGPALPANPYAWYRAEVGVEEAAGDPAEAGDGIAVWRDQSGNNRHLDHILGTAPIFQTSVINGRPAVEFNNNGAIWDDSASWGIITQPNTVFVVAMTEATNNDYVFDSASGAGRHALIAGDPTAPSDWTAYAGSVLHSAAVSADEFLIHTLLFDGPNGAHYLNGWLQAAGAIGSQSMAGLALGTRYSGTAYYLDGAIAEVLVYDRALSYGEQMEVVKYLGLKYGLSVAPEPGTLSLLGLGGLALLRRRRRKRSSQGARASGLRAGGQLLAALALLVTLTAGASAEMIPIVDGTFTGSNGSQPVGWFEDSGDVRVFANTMISVGAGNTYEARHNTSVAIEPDTTYVLRFDTGFQASNARDGDYQAQIGTWSGGGNGVFALLATSTALLNQTGNEYRFSTGGFLTSKVMLNTTDTVSGDSLAVRLNNPTDTAPWLGFDNATLEALPTLFRQDFDSAVIGTWAESPDSLITTGTGAATSGAAKPRNHDLNSGTWVRFDDGTGGAVEAIAATATLATAMRLDGQNIFSFDVHVFTSSTAGRVADVTGYNQNGEELFSVGWDMQQNLYINGVQTADTAFDGLQWTNVELVLHEATWDLTVTQYYPAGAAGITTATGLGGITENFSDLPYLNVTGGWLTQFVVDGNANSVSSEPLTFMDNFVVAGSAIPEPGTLSLLGLGGLTLLRRRRRKA